MKLLLLSLCLSCVATNGSDPSLGVNVQDIQTNNYVQKWNGTAYTDSSAVDDATTFAVGENLQVTTGTGQAALFSTKRATSTDGYNLCAGGGCQSVAYNGVSSATGSTNTGFGLLALSALTTGYSNTAIGYAAMTSITSGVLNMAFGGNALAACTGCAYNTAIGDHAMSTFLADPDNTCVGQACMLNITAGDGNVAIGVQSLEGGATNQTITHSVAIGLNAAQGVLTGAAQIVAVGYQSLSAVTTAAAPTALGAFSLKSLTTGTGSTGIGASVGPDLTTGQYNTFVGGLAGGGITTGDKNTIVGAQIGGLAAGTTKKIILADGSGTAVDQIWFSPTAPTSVNHGSLGTGSSNTAGNVTGIGANTSVVLTYSNNGFPNRSWCQVTTETGNQHINVTRSATAPTFTCINNATGLAANCEDFTYWCSGQ